MYANLLPFPRGEFGANSDTTLVNSYPHLEGLQVEVPNTEHSDDTPIRLICLRNDSGASITLARKFYRFAQGSQDFGRAIVGLADTAGMLAVAADQKYNGKVWISNDYAWFVLRGSNNMITGATSVNLGTQVGIVTDALGCVAAATAAAGETVLGIVDQATAAETTAVRCHIDIDLKPAEAAG